MSPFDTVEIAHVVRTGYRGLDYRGRFFQVQKFELNFSSDRISGGEPHE